VPKSPEIGRFLFLNRVNANGVIIFDLAEGIKIKLLLFDDIHKDGHLIR